MKAKEFLQNVLKYCIPSVVSAVLSIAVIPVVSRVFPPEDFGKINLFYSVGYMLLYVFLLGLDSAYIRFYFEGFRGIRKEQIFSMSFWGSLAINICVTVTALLFFSDRVSRYLFGEYRPYLLLVLSVYVFSLTLFRLLSIEARMDGKSLLFNVQQVLLIVTNRVTYVVAILFSTNYRVSILLITGSTALLSIWFLIRQKRFSDFSLGSVDKASVGRILNFAVPLMPTTVMVWLNNSAAKFVLSGYGNFNLLGILTIATSLANVFSLVPSAFTTYWSPFMYRNYKKEQAFIRDVHNYILLLSVGIVLCFYCMQDLVYIIVGEKYRASQSFFMLIMLVPVQSLLCETTSYGIILANKTRINLYVSVAAVAANIGLGYLLYPSLHVYGIVIGIVSAAAIQLVFKTVIGQHFYQSIRNKWTTAASVLLIVGISLSNVWLYDRFFIRMAVTFAVLALSGVLFRAEYAAAWKLLKGRCLSLTRRGRAPSA